MALPLICVRSSAPVSSNTTFEAVPDCTRKDNLASEFCLHYLGTTSPIEHVARICRNPSPAPNLAICDI